MGHAAPLLLQRSIKHPCPYTIPTNMHLHNMHTIIYAYTAYSFQRVHVHGYPICLHVQVRVRVCASVSVHPCTCLCVWMRVACLSPDCKVSDDRRKGRVKKKPMVTPGPSALAHCTWMTSLGHTDRITHQLSKTNWRDCLMLQIDDQTDRQAHSLKGQRVLKQTDIHTRSENRN